MENATENTALPSTEFEYSYGMSEKVQVDITLEAGAELPQYMTEGATCMDLYAYEDIELPSRTPVAVRTGISLAIPKGYEGQIRPRSGLALKGVTVFNAPGCLDCDYRGEVKVILISMLNIYPYKITKGDRIAQLSICKVSRAVLNPVLFLDETARGVGGFGHTGELPLPKGRGFSVR